MGFPSLIDPSDQPKYLICLFRTWTFVANYLNTDKRLILPGYREDWKITIQVLDTDEIYKTKTLPGQDPAETQTFMQSSTPLTEVVGVAPLEEVRALLLGKLSKPYPAAVQPERYSRILPIPSIYCN